MMLLRVRSLAMGRSGVRPVVAAVLGRRCSTPASCRGCPSTVRSAPPATSRRWRTARWCSSARAGCSRPDGARLTPADGRCERAGIAPIDLVRQGGPGAHQRHGRHARHADAGRGRLAAPVHHGGRDARRWRSRRCSAPTGRSSPSCTRSGPSRARRRAAANIHRLLQDSEVMDSHRNDLAHAVQDAYSMRCAPQVAGAARDVLAYAETVAAQELRSVVDNPVVLPDGRVESTGNFHGAPLGLRGRFPRHRGGGRRLDRRTPRRPHPRRHPFPGPAGVPEP